MTFESVFGSAGYLMLTSFRRPAIQTTSRIFLQSLIIGLTKWHFLFFLAMFASHSPMSKDQKRGKQSLYAPRNHEPSNSDP